MTTQQLKKIEEFAKTFYNKTGKFHAWDHIEAVVKNAILLSRKSKKINMEVLLAACYLHDIGRSIKDEGHPLESAKLSEPFLLKIGLSRDEVQQILHVVVSHDKDKILDAETLEAKILFDADKLEIMSVNGFIRTVAWLIEERNMETKEAVNFLWKWVLETEKRYIQTTAARKIIRREFKVLRLTIDVYQKWDSR